MRRLLFALAAAVAIGTPVRAQDPVKVDPKHHKVEFENDQVRVLRVKFGAGETSPEHEHPARVTVFLHDYQTTNKLSDGSVDRRQRPAGDIEWRGPVKHIPYADVAYENIQVEIKPQSPRPAPPTLPSDAVRIDPNHFTVKFENEFVRVLRVRIGPMESPARHELTAGILVLLTDFESQLSTADGKTIDRKASSGEVVWFDPGMQIIKNAGSQALNAVLIQLK
jgi:hypothetical protein